MMDVWAESPMTVVGTSTSSANTVKSAKTIAAVAAAAAASPPRRSLPPVPPPLLIGAQPNAQGEIRSDHDGADRLRGYESALEAHLRKVLWGIEAEINKLTFVSRTESTNESALASESRSLEAEVARLRRNAAHQRAAQRAAQASRRKANAQRKAADSALADANECLKQQVRQEKTVRGELGALNQRIASALGELDAVAWPERNDVKLLRAIVGRAASRVSVLEKEKHLQDAYLERLQKDVELAEEEMRKLAESAKLIKSQEDDDRRRFSNFHDRLRAFESGSLQLEDHWQRLLSTLCADRNRIALSGTDATDENIDGNSDGDDRDDSERIGGGVSSGFEDDNLWLLAQKLKREVANQQKEIEVIEAQNRNIREQYHRRLDDILPRLSKQKDEKCAIANALNNKFGQVNKEHEKHCFENGVASQQQPNTTPPNNDNNNDENNNNNNINNNNTTNNNNNNRGGSGDGGELEIRIFSRQISVFKSFLDEIRNFRAAQTLKFAAARHRAKNEDGGGGAGAGGRRREVDGSYSQLRRLITQLIRKRIALTFKKQRIGEEIEILKDRFKSVRHDTELATREFRELDNCAFHFDHATNAFELDADEARKGGGRSMASDAEKRAAFLRRVDDSALREHRLRAEVSALRVRLAGVRSQCALWRAKCEKGAPSAIDGAGASREQLACLNAIHALQKAHQADEMQLWRIQRELEFVVMHRDYDMHMAQAVVIGSTTTTRGCALVQKRTNAR